MRDELDDSSDSNASDGQQKKKKTHKAHQASSGSSSGMLSGSFLSNGTSRNDSTGEGKKLKKRTSRLGDVEWAAAMLGEERVKAVLKGIDKLVIKFSQFLYSCRVYEMALDQDNFDIFGNDMIQVRFSCLFPYNHLVLL